MPLPQWLFVYTFCIVTVVIPFAQVANSASSPLNPLNQRKNLRTGPYFCRRGNLPSPACCSCSDQARVPYWGASYTRSDRPYWSGWP